MYNLRDDIFDGEMRSVLKSCGSLELAPRGHFLPPDTAIAFPALLDKGKKSVTASTSLSPHESVSFQ
jgi:hypothetical protein